MPRVKPDGKKANWAYVDSDLLDRFKGCCGYKHVTMSDQTEALIRAWVEREEKQREGGMRG